MHIKTVLYRLIPVNYLPIKLKFRFTPAHMHTLVHSDRIFTGHTEITLAVKTVEVDHCFTWIIIIIILIIMNT